MNFPAEFRILGHLVRIEVIAAADWQHGETCVGVWLPGSNRIELRGDQCESVLLHTLCHEWVHCILTQMNHKLAHNETFVDQFGGLLAQVLSTLEPRRKAAGKRRAKRK